MNTAVRSSIVVALFVAMFGGVLVAKEAKDAPPFPEAKGNWVHSADEGWKAARDNKKLVLIDFWYPSCYWCKVLTETVLNTDVVQKSLPAFNLVKINRDESEENQALCKRYGITAFPSVVFTDADGVMVDTVVGGKHVPEEFAKLLDEIAEKGGRLAWLSRLVAEKPKDIELRYQRMMLCKPMYGWKQIAEDCDVFLAETKPETESRYAEVLLLSGQSKSLNGTFASAIEDLHRFETLFPKNTQRSFGLMLLASDYAQSGKIAEAGRYYRRLYREFPNTYHASTGCAFFVNNPAELRKGMKIPPGATSKWDQDQWRAALDAFAKLPAAEQLEDEETVKAPSAQKPADDSQGEDF